MRKLFVIHDDGDPVSTDVLAQSINRFLAQHDVSGTAKWYYDEDEDPIEFGVRIDLGELPATDFDKFLRELDDFCSTRVESLHVQRA